MMKKILTVYLQYTVKFTNRQVQLEAMWALLIVLFILLVFCGNQLHRLFMLKRWRHSLNLDVHQPVYLELFANVDGFDLSRAARNTSDAMEYVYGEIEFVSFIALLSLAKPNINTVFYDLGSGTGTAVLACAMVFNIKASCGIEIFPLLHNVACRQKASLSSLGDYEERAKNIHFFNGDFLQTRFDNATLIFINATSFFGQTWTQISELIDQIATCETVITTSKALKSSVFTVTKITIVEMSWGFVKAYIQQRIVNTVDIIK